MELSHSLILNEEALTHFTDHKQSIFVFEWLRFLNRVLPVAQKVNNTIYFYCVLLRHLCFTLHMLLTSVLVYRRW